MSAACINTFFTKRDDIYSIFISDYFQSDEWRIKRLCGFSCVCQLQDFCTGDILSGFLPYIYTIKHAI